MPPDANNCKRTPRPSADHRRMETATMRGCCLLTIVLVAAALPSAASAQVIYNNASTAAEGLGRGIGDVVRSQGEYNLNTSQAAINLTQARSQEIDNRMQATQTYFAMRNLNTQQRYGDYAQK